MTTPDMTDSEFRAAVDHIVDGVFFGAPDGRVFYANPAASQLLGGGPAELTAAAQGEVREPVDPGWQSLLEERRRRGWMTGRVTMYRLDGTPFVGEVSSAILQGSDGEERTCWMVRDVTKLVRTERRLAAYDEIAEALLAGRQTAEVLELVARHACAIFDAVSAAIVTPDLNSQGLVIAAAHGQVADLVGRSFPPGGIAGSVMTSRRPLLVEDITLAARTHQVRSLGMGPGMVVPILAGEGPAGALCIGARQGRHPYDAEDLADAAKYAVRAGLTLSLDWARSERERRDRLRAEQLQQALDSRVIIDQAKGFMACMHDIDPEEAFERLRNYARSHNAKIHEVARQVVDRRLRL